MEGHLRPKKKLREFERTPLVEITGKISMFFWYIVLRCFVEEKTWICFNFRCLGLTQTFSPTNGGWFDGDESHGIQSAKKHQQKTHPRELCVCFYIGFFTYIKKQAPCLRLGNVLKGDRLTLPGVIFLVTNPKTPSSKPFFLPKFFLCQTSLDSWMYRYQHNPYEKNPSIYNLMGIYRYLWLIIPKNA